MSSSYHAAQYLFLVMWPAIMKGGNKCLEIIGGGEIFAAVERREISRIGGNENMAKIKRNAAWRKRENSRNRRNV
jgi:hypothetical protein